MKAGIDDIAAYAENAGNNTFRGQVDAYFARPAAKSSVAGKGWDDKAKGDGAPTIEAQKLALEWAKIYRTLETENANMVYGVSEWDQKIAEVMRKYADLAEKEGADLTRLNTLRGEHIALLQKQKDIEYTAPGGAKKALDDYAEAARKTGTLINGAFTNAFRGMEDALVKFVMTGKLSFKDLANSIISDMIRIMIQQQITGPLAAGMKGLFGNASGTENFSGGMTRVGERGPEDVFLPQGSRIVPAHKSGGDAPTVAVAVNIENKTGSQVQATEGGMRFNGKDWVKSIILELKSTDNDMRQMLGA
jgi:hypothetical protein